MVNHYVIGDVHGNYNTLLELVSKIPINSKLIFVGDLIDRGPHSSSVVKYVRENNHLCVLGNHEDMMVEELPRLLKLMEREEKIENMFFSSTWIHNGGKETLESYNYNFKNKIKIDPKDISILKSDLKWMKSLPLFIEIKFDKDSNEENNINLKNKVVISHSCISNVWNNRSLILSKFRRNFKEHAIWKRKKPKGDVEIFNIFGHSIVEFGVDINKNYVNVDTGCYKKKHGYNQLSAYCIETGETISVKSID